jgi:NAD(P)-dependent dehydrogenase (short-subunit alcohol dehydrogenase family)
MNAPVQGLQDPARVLVTGASSGIGLAMVQALLEDAAVARVYAVSRRGGACEVLQALRERHGERLQAVAADLTCDTGLADVAAAAASGGALHLVVNCAGILHGAGLRPEKSLATLQRDALAQVFALNAFAPVLLAKALLPLLGPGAPRVFASLSARVGSISDNRLGGWYAYRASKAAQNQLLRTLAIEWRRTHPHATCVLLHPGTVDTPLSRPFQANVPPAALSTPGHAARRLLDVIAGLTPADSGRFIAWDGSPVPW